MKILSSFLLFFLNVILVILSGLLISYMWLIFIVPYFNMPPISIPVSIGISLIVKFMTYQITTSDLLLEKEELEKIKWIRCYVHYFVVLIIFFDAWIVSLFL